MGDYIVIGILVAIMAWIIASIIIRKKKGGCSGCNSGSGCSGSCSSGSCSSRRPNNK